MTVEIVLSPRTEAAMRYQAAVEQLQGIDLRAIESIPPAEQAKVIEFAAAWKALEAHHEAPEPNAESMAKSMKGRPLPNRATVEKAADEASAEYRAAHKRHDRERTQGVPRRIQLLDERLTLEPDYPADAADLDEIRAWDQRLRVTHAAYRVASAISDDLQALRQTVYAEERREARLREAKWEEERLEAERAEAKQLAEWEADALAATLAADPPNEQTARAKSLIEAMALRLDDVEVLAIHALTSNNNADIERGPGGRVSKVRITAR